MNTPKELQRIYNKLPKTELKSQKVELNEIQDLQSAALKISKLRDGAVGANKDALTIENNLKPLLKTIEKEKNFAKDILEAATNNSIINSAKEELKSSFNKLSNAANDLGVSPNKLPVYKDYESALNEIKEYEGFIKDAISITKKILK
tara:strand:+ start:987 stop:1430 length:444 start_codon:yes stop_codon:yes gene_type:complete